MLRWRAMVSVRRGRSSRRSARRAEVPLPPGSGRPRRRRTVTFRLGERVVALLLPEEPPQPSALQAERMDDLVPRRSAGSRPSSISRATREAGFVPRPIRRTPPSRNVDRAAAHVGAFCPDVRRHVAEPDGDDAPSSTFAHVTGAVPRGRLRLPGSPPRSRAMPSSSAQVTSAIVLCPQAVEYPALWKNTTPRSSSSSYGRRRSSRTCPRGREAR